MLTPRGLVFLMALVAVAALAVGPAQADLKHRYTFSDADLLTDSVGDADGVAMGDVLVSGDNVLVNLLGGTGARDGRVDLLANGANGININTYSAVTIEFWATPNCAAVDGSCAPYPNDSFSTALGFGSTYGPPDLPAPEVGPTGAGADYIIMQTHRAVDFLESRGAIAVTQEDTLGAPWLAETGGNGPEFNDSAEHHYALVIGEQTLTFYVDGVSMDGPIFLANPNSHGLANSLAGVSNDHVWIGTAYTIDQSWAGAMNELRIWDAAGAAEYVAASFAAGPNQLADFVELVEIPEPATCGLALLGLFSLGVFRRRARG
jgi:hypothetical protein